jgi:triosephosphate isomerase
MAERRKLLVGAWKAYLNHGDAIALARELASATQAGGTGGDLGFDLGVCPSFISIVAVQEVLASTPIRVGAQSLYWETENGAFTSQVTAEQIADLGCPLVILGHSEVRALGESDADVSRRVRAALAKGIAPIVCIGESMAERRAGSAESLVAGQVLAAIDGLSAEQVEGIVFAYEPIWAIKSRDNPEAVPAKPDEANAMHRAIRDALTDRLDGGLGERVRVLYGGSVGPDNAAEFAGQSEVDGMLVGSASVKAEKFLGILDAVAAAAASATGN